MQPRAPATWIYIKNRYCSKLSIFPCLVNITVICLTNIPSSRALTKHPEETDWKVKWLLCYSRHQSEQCSESDFPFNPPGEASPSFAAASLRLTAAVDSQSTLVHLKRPHKSLCSLFGKCQYLGFSEPYYLPHGEHNWGECQFVIQKSIDALSAWSIQEAYSPPQL